MHQLWNNKSTKWQVLEIMESVRQLREKKNNPDYYNAMKCPDCSATSNNTAALCWKMYGKCGKCAYKKPDHRTHVLCKDCNEVTYKLSYQKLGRHSINLFYCIGCSGIITKNSHRIFQMREQIIATPTRIWEGRKCH